MKTVATGILAVFMLIGGPFVGLSSVFEVAAHAGTIKGSVLNETLDKKGMENREVTLFQYQENKATEISRTRSDHKGLYVFKEIDTDKDKKYYTAAGYKDVTYYSEVGDFQQKEEINLDVAVFEPTDRDDHIQIKVHHILVNVYEDGLAFNEIIVVENTGNRTYIGKPRADSGRNQTLQVSLPGEASDIQLMSPSLVNSENGLIDTSAIIPGTKRIAFSYWIHPGAASYLFEKTFNRQTDKFNMIFPDKGIQVRSDQLQIKTAEGNSGQHYVYLEGENLARNAHIAVELSRSRETHSFQWLIAGLLTLLTGTAFSLPFLKTKKPQK